MVRTLRKGNCAIGADSRWAHLTEATMKTSKEKTAQIRELNDAFRRTFEGGRVMLTSGVDALPADVRAAVIWTVTTFTDFSPDNDPHKEHDFGSFECEGEKCFWKIDYYSPDMQHGSEDPSDLDENNSRSYNHVGRRILRFVLALPRICGALFCSCNS